MIAGLSVCGIFLSVTAAAAGTPQVGSRTRVPHTCVDLLHRLLLILSVLDWAGLMGDFRTGWITLTSPRSMFVAQVVGSLVSLQNAAFKPYP